MYTPIRKLRKEENGMGKPIRKLIIEEMNG